ncbi:hypothetical protein Tco_0608913 [Tanacetum coccineum]
MTGNLSSPSKNATQMEVDFSEFTSGGSLNRKIQRLLLHSVEFFPTSRHILFMILGDEGLGWWFTVNKLPLNLVGPPLDPDKKITVPKGVRFGRKKEAVETIGSKYGVGFPLTITCVFEVWSRVSKFLGYLVEDDRLKQFSFNGVTFSLRLSSFLRDGNGIDALGTGVTTGANMGDSGFGLRMLHFEHTGGWNVFGASVISRRHRRSFVNRHYDLLLSGPWMGNNTSGSDTFKSSS